MLRSLVGSEMCIRDSHRLMMLKSFVEMKHQLADKEQRLQYVERQLEESQLLQQQTNQRLDETTARLNEAEETLRRSQQDHKEVVKQMKDSTKNFASSIKLLSNIFLEKYYENDFKKNLAAFNNKMDKGLEIKDTIKMFDEELSFQETVSLKKHFLQKCYKEKFKRLCSSMEVEQAYFDSSANLFLKIAVKKDWLKPKCMITYSTYKLERSKSNIVHETENVQIYLNENELFINIHNLPLGRRFNVHLVNPTNDYKTKVSDNFILAEYIYDGYLSLIHI